MSIFQTLSVADRVAKQQADAAASAAQSQQNYNSEQAKYFQNQEDYVSGKRNPVADLIRKPERDAAKEERLKQVAKWSFISDAVSLIGKGYAASKGVMPTPTNSEGTYKALTELNKLDDIYREEGYRYDHNMMLDALRRQGAASDLDKTKLGLAQNESNYNRSKADKLNDIVLNLDIAKERQDAAKAEKAEERAWNVERDDKNYKRQVALVTAKSNASSKDTDYAGYKIQGINGDMIPMSKTIETQIITSAKQRGIKIAADLNNTSILMSNPSDSPERRAEIQRLYNEVEKADAATAAPEDIGDVNFRNTSPKFQQLVGGLRKNDSSTKGKGNEVFMSQMSAEIFPKLLEINPSDRRNVLEEFLNRMPVSVRDGWIRANQDSIERLIGK